MEDYDNPIELIKSSLSSIEDKIDKLSGSKDNSALKSQMTDIASSLKTIADSIETDDVRQQRQTEMEQHIAKGINTQMSNVTESIKNFNNGLGDKLDRLSKLQVVGHLTQEDRETMQLLSQVLSVTDARGKAVQAQEAIRQTEEKAVENIKKQSELSSDDIEKSKKDIYNAANDGIKNVNRASYEARDRVIEASRWLVFFFKKKWLWLTIAIVAWVCFMVGAAVMMNNAYGKQRAAEQALKNANDVIEHMPDYRYWIIWKSKNPVKSKQFMKEADAQYGDRLYKETINPKNYFE